MITETRIPSHTPTKILGPPPIGTLLAFLSLPYSPLAVTLSHAFHDLVLTFIKIFTFCGCLTK